MSNKVVGLSTIETGTIVAEDVYLNTIYPIVRKDTIITEEHINVLRTFAIQEITIKSNASATLTPKKEDVEPLKEVEPIQEVKQPTFQAKYLKAVQQVEKEFDKWRAGVHPDIAIVRSIIVPLLKQLNGVNNELSFLTTVPTKDDYIYHHSVAVGMLAYAIGEKMNLSSGEAIQLGLAGTLIDCGMTRVSPTVVNKAGPLTTKEFNEIKKHPIHSFQMVNDSPLLRTEMKLAILQHHERLDGGGYPRREKREDISLYAQILGVADVYHARISDRIYRAKESPYKVLESFRDDYQAFNVKVINALYEVVGSLSIGTRVELSNGERGGIVYLHPNDPFRPIVELDADKQYADLTKMRSVTIERIL